MSTAARIGIGVAIAAEVLGFLFICGTLYFLSLYALDPTDPLRHEYLFGVALTLLYGAGSGLTASLLAGALKKSLSPNAFRWIAWPGLGFCAILLVLFLGTVAFDFFQRTT